MNPTEMMRSGYERSFSINLLKLNGLIDAELGDDAEADAVRDDMDSDWKRMDEIQRVRMSYLSVELDHLAQAEYRPDYAGPVDRQWADELQQARQHFGTEGADRILALLRDSRAVRPSGNFFYIQAKQYERLGMPEVARAFYGAAEARSVDNLTLLSVA